jgi:hypothetical protein
VPHRTGKNCQSCHTRDKWWEAAGCVDHTDRVQLQRHAKLVSVQTQACPAVCSTQPANALHVLLCAIHTVSHFHSVTLEATVQLSGLTRVFVHVLAFSSTPSYANTAEFSSTPSHAAAAARVCALSTTCLVCCNCLTVVLRGTALQHRTGPSWASNDDPLKDLSNTRALKHLAPLATNYWAASHSFIEPGHSCFHLKFEQK